MQVDWLTVIAQVVNFLVLVYLLKRFLYGPIVNAMSRREQLIADRLQVADTREEEARLQAEAYEAQQRELEASREALLEQARDEAQTERNTQMDGLRQEIAAVRERWLQEVEAEKRDFLREAKRGIGQQACEIARRLLKNLADAELEQQLVDSFLRHLAGEEGMEELRRALSEQTSSVLVSSHYELKPDHKAAIEQLLGDLKGETVPTKYRLDPAMTCGISLQFTTHKIAWGIEDQLDDLEESLGEVLATPAATETVRS